MAEFPSMNWWADAYLADTRHLSLEEHGAYRLLLDIAWRSPNQALPDDDRRFANMLGITRPRWLKLKPVVMRFWQLGPHGWTQKRLQKEWENAQNRSNKARDAANERWSAKSLKSDKSDGASADAQSDAQRVPPLTTDHTLDAKEASNSVLPRKRSPKKTIPHDWKPQPFGEGTKSADIVKRWIFTDDGEFERQVEAFKAHHGSRANVMADWQSAWSTWVLNSERFNRSRMNGHGAGRDRTLSAAEGAFGPASEWSDDRPF